MVVWFRGSKELFETELRTWEETQAQFESHYARKFQAELDPIYSKLL